MNISYISYSKSATVNSIETLSPLKVNFFMKTLRFLYCVDMNCVGHIANTTKVLIAVLGLLFFFSIPYTSHAALELDWNFYHPATGIEYPENVVHMVDGGVYAVPFNIGSYFTIDVDYELPAFTEVQGELYFIPDPSTGEREFIGPSYDVLWQQEGIYEIDVYEVVVAPMRSPWERFIAWILPTAHAAPPFSTYVGTVRFSITEGPPPPPPCCSSVLFLPGFQGSVLKEGDNTLWPPTAFTQDVERLAITENGDSVNTIVVGGILEDFYTVSIYSGLSSFMDGLVDEETINAWEPFSYDWRMPLEKVLNEGVMREGEDEVIELVETIEDLASESKTGKVTIVAHSMGGLLGKALIKRLEEEGNADIVDSFVMVGTPQLGTPQGAAAILHGNEQAILGGILVKSSAARAVAQNMESAYSLLPSPRYFDEVQDPVITFDENASFTEGWRNRWGSTIDTYAEFEEFITGTGVPRFSPDADEMEKPEVLNSTLVSNARDFHDTFDDYTLPSHIHVVQIAGWGMETVKTIEYTKKHIFFEGYKTDNITREGDNTVVYASAISTDEDSKYFFNIFDYNELLNQNIQHRDLLNAEPLQELIKAVIERTEENNIDFITETRPSVQDLDDQLLVVTRSPVLLGARDNQGRFTGVDPNQDLSSDVLMITEDIPSSSFVVSGGDQYVFLPKEGTYTFEFIGTGTGPATVETATLSGDTITPVATYTDIPVTPQTEAGFSISADAPQDTFIEVDSNGDGQTDVSVTPDGYVLPPTLGELIAGLKAKIQGLNVKDKLKTRLLNKIEKLEKKIAKQKKLRASRIVTNLEQKIIKKGSKGKITDADVEDILEMLEEIEKAL